MKIKVLEESGITSALAGLGLSYSKTPEALKLADMHFFSKMMSVAYKLAFNRHGENKFLESIIIWMDITAPRYWWQEFDTYRQLTKQSQSTMKTILNNTLTNDDFENEIEQSVLEKINQLIKERDITRVKNNLPEGFLQRRIVCLSYKTLQNIYSQRHNHKLPQWQFFCHNVLTQVAYPEFICKDYK